MIGLSFTSLGDLKRGLSGAIDKDSLDCCRGREIQEKHVNSLLRSKYHRFQAMGKKERKCEQSAAYTFDSTFCVIVLHKRAWLMRSVTSLLVTFF